MAKKTVATLTLHDLYFLKTAMETMRSYEAAYAGAPDPLYDLGKTLGPRIFDPAYREAIEKGFTSQTAYLIKVLEGLPDLTTFNTYINGPVMAAAGQPSTNLKTALFEGAWVATLMDYADLVCPCTYQKNITYEGGPRPETPPPVPAPAPALGSMHVMLGIEFDRPNMILKGTMQYHHLEGPLPYFDDFIGALYTEEDTTVSYSMGDFLIESGELCHAKRTEDWRLGQNLVINPYMTQFGVYIKTDSSVAYNLPGRLSSAIWLNNWDEFKGKVHSPLTMPFEDWYVIYHMVPHSSMTDIMSRASTTITVQIGGTEYVWFPPAATPWIP